MRLGPFAVLLAVVSGAFYAGLRAFGPVVAAVAAAVAFIAGRIAIHRERVRQVAATPIKVYFQLRKDGLPLEVALPGTLSVMYHKQEERKLRAVQYLEHLASVSRDFVDGLPPPERERMLLHSLVGSVFHIEVGRGPNETENHWLSGDAHEVLASERARHLTSI